MCLAWPCLSSLCHSKWAHGETDVCCTALTRAFICRGRIDSLQREVSDLNAQLMAAASRVQSDASAAEWAPYFQAAQRDHEQKIQVVAFGVLGALAVCFDCGV